MQGLAALAGSQRARLEEAAVRRIEDQNRHRRIVESMHKEHAEQLRAQLRSVGQEFHVQARGGGKRRGGDDGEMPGRRKGLMTTGEERPRKVTRGAFWSF